jgi:hypothetical protein
MNLVIILFVCAASARTLLSLALLTMLSLGQLQTMKELVLPLQALVPVNLL